MLKVGLTGGIGSGKTTVSQVFKNLGVPIFNSDLVARDIVNTDDETINAIKLQFGEAMYNADGLDRKALASKVFNHPEELQKLNNIVHPKVAERFNAWCREQAGVPYIIKEAAILFETGTHQNLDRVIVVYTQKEERIRRIIERDNSTREEVESRMSNQWDDQTRNKLADFIIINDDLELVLPQVMELHELLIGAED
jgi:dephospho-CoA kinase